MFEGKFADRMDFLQPSPIRKITAIVSDVRAEGKKVYALNIGQPDVAAIPAFGEAVARKATEDPQVSYTAFIGEKYLRETYARYLNNYFERKNVSHFHIDTHNVAVTVGASHGLTCVFLALFNPGDEVLVFEPFFSAYRGFVVPSGAKLKAIPTKAEESFALPPEEVIEKYITPKTRGILVNSPCNPCGTVRTAEEMDMLARICVKHNLYFISDEVYREMVMGDEEVTCVFEVDLKNDEDNEALKNLMICVDSASKSFSLCGARIGFVVSKKEITDKVSHVVSNTVACISDTLQYGVAAAYDEVLRDPSYLKKIRAVYRERRDATMAAIKEYLPNAVAPVPEGAFYVVVKFPEFEDISEYAMYMLTKFNLGGETVAITPAAGFYMTEGAGKNEMRIALVLEPEEMRRSIQIMAEALESYKEYKKSANADPIKKL